METKDNNTAEKIYTSFPTPEQLLIDIAETVREEKLLEINNKEENIDPIPASRLTFIFMALEE
jgi:hypothetical protein